MQKIVNVKQLRFGNMDTITRLNDTDGLAQRRKVLALTLCAMPGVVVDRRLADQAFNKTANVDIERDLTVVRHGNRRQMLVTREKGFNLIDDFAGIENGDRLNYPAQGEVFHDPFVNLHHVGGADKGAEQRHQCFFTLTGNQRIQRNPGGYDVYTQLLRNARFQQAA
ncbi:MAG: hypothetical protein K0R86_2493 [Enterobacter kobei]|nr:hypothetical protein [Enterobacter kobei]